MEAIEPIYVLDTHALLWYLTGNKRLGTRAANIFDAADRGETQLIVSAIVLAELYHLNQKRESPLNFTEVFYDLADSSAYQLVPFEAGHVLDFPQDAAVTELHDRIIAGLARRLDAPLISMDPVIQAAGVARIEW